MNRHGGILIITLWALSMLSIFAVSVGYVARMQMRYAAHFQERVKLYYLAVAGIEKAIVELENTEDPGYTAFDLPILNDEESLRDIALGDGFITLSYTVSEGIPGKERTIYGIMDESSKIDINSVPVDILSTMLERIAGIEKEQSYDIARAIEDWRAGTPDPKVKKYYEELEIPYENKGEKFEAAEELLLVRGMPKEAFLKIKDIITVYGTEKVNINTAGFDVLYALGLNRRLSERIIEYRRDRDGAPGTKDDNVFKTVNDLRNIGFLFTEDSMQINSLISNNIIKSQSDTFRINSFSHLKEGQDGASRNIICVLKLQAEQRPKILYWHEN